MSRLGKRNDKQIKVTLEKVDQTKDSPTNVVGVAYHIKEMTNAIMLDARWWGLRTDYRVGQSMSEEEAEKLCDAKRVTVRVID